MNLSRFRAVAVALACGVVLVPGTASATHTPDTCYLAPAHSGLHTARYTFGDYFQHYGSHQYRTGSAYPCTKHAHIVHYH